MAEPRFLLLALTFREAERTRDAFGLDPETWEIGCLLQAGRGRRFEKVVAVLPPLLDDVRVKDAVQHLRTFLRPEGELIFL